MDELIRMLGTLNHLCELLNAKGNTEYSVTDWVFGFVVFENNAHAFDGNFLDTIKYLTDKL